MFAPMGQAIKAGDNVAAAGALLDAVGERTGVLQELPPELQTVVRDHAARCR